VNVQLTLVGKPGCHLCDDARETVQRIVAEFRADFPSARISFEELNILEDEELARVHLEEIPVLKINGRVHNFWRIDPDRFRKALEDLVGL
jgi:glutaredoxin